MTAALDISRLSNRQIRLASRPNGMPARDNWRVTTEAVAAPGPGGVLVKTLYLSLDPAMRGWMNEGKSYIAPVEIGAGSPGFPPSRTAVRNKFCRAVHW